MKKARKLVVLILSVCLVIVTILLGLPIFASTSTEVYAMEADLQWVFKADLPEPRRLPAAAVASGKIYVLGGDYRLSNYVYDPAGDIWTTKAPLPGNGTDEGGAAVINNKIYVVGDPFDHDIKIYNISADTWSIGANLPTIRRGIGVAAVGGKVYTIGGTDGNLRGFGVVEVYDPATNSWTRKADMPTPRGFAAIAVVDGRIYVFGGRNNELPQDILNSVEVYDPATNTWEIKSSMPTARNSVAAGVINGKIYVVGGFSGSRVLNTVEEYDPAADAWTMKSPIAVPRSGLVVGVVNSKIYVISGSTESGYTKTVEEGSLHTYNQPPIAYIDAISPQTPSEGEQITFNGHGADSDGSIVAYNWRSRIDGQLSTSDSFSTSSLSIGTHTIYFKVKDNDGQWSAEVTKTLTVTKPNKLPEAYIDSILPGLIKKGEAVSFSGHGTDSDGSVVGYNWRSSIDGELEVSASFSTSMLSVGTHTIYFKVRDDDSAWSEEVVGTVTVKDNTSPVAFIDSISPKKVKIGSDVSFSGHGTDSDGSVVGYNWRSSIDGELEVSALFSSSMLSVGTHTIYFKVKDDDGAWSEEENDTVIIEANETPAAFIDAISPNRAEQGAEVSFRGHGVDIDGTVVSYSWTSDIDGQLSTSGLFTNSSLSIGKHTISFKVKDDNGAWSEEVTSILMIERPGPYVELYGNRTIVDVGDEILLELSVINPITSPGNLIVQLTLSIPSGWSVTSSGFGHGAGGLRTNTYTIEQGAETRTINVHILANEPYDEVISGYLDYYFEEEEEYKYHKDISLAVIANLPPPTPEEVASSRSPEQKAPSATNGGGFSCSSPAKAIPVSSSEIFYGLLPIGLLWGGLGGICGILRWHKGRTFMGNTNRKKKREVFHNDHRECKRT